MNQSPVDDSMKRKRSQWWRWPLVPIASLAGAIAGGAAYALIWSLFSGASSDSLFVRYISPLLAGGMFGYLVPQISHIVAPAGKVPAAICMTVIALVTHVVGVTIQMVSPEHGAPLLAEVLYVAAAMVTAVTTLKGMYDQEHLSRKFAASCNSRFDYEKREAPDDAARPGVGTFNKPEAAPTDVPDGLAQSESLKFRQSVELLLDEQYTYELQPSDDPRLERVCDDAELEGLMPGDAAAAFIEEVCLALASRSAQGNRGHSLNDLEAIFIERMALVVVETANHRLASLYISFERSVRLYLLSKGAPVSRLHEVDQMLETFCRATYEAEKSGLSFDANARFGLLLQMAHSRGIIPKPPQIEGGTITMYASK
jgi:hypothetical protein